MGRFLTGFGLRVAAGLLAVACAIPCFAQDFTAFVETDDGTLLATDVYFTFGDEPWPVILIRTPYDKESLFDVGLLLALSGYAVVIQDTRGRYESTGVDTVFRDDAEDGRITVDWVAAQDWCDGNIGTFGGSAFAITQYLLAPYANAALRSIMPAVATADLYHHGFLQGGALRESLAYNWLADQGSLDIYDEIRAHRLKDQWWDPVEVHAHSGQVDATGLHIGGWYDIFGQGTLDAFVEFQNRGGSGARGRQYLIMGPWSHGSLGEQRVGELFYPDNSELDLLDVVIPWYSHTLKGRRNDVDDWPAVRIYLMGAADEPGAPGNQWLELETWPPTGRRVHMFLGADGALSQMVPEAGELELVMDPDDPVPTLGGNNLHPNLQVDGRAMGDGPHDQRPVEQHGDVLSFTSEVLNEPLTVIGPLSATVWIRPDTTDLDLSVRLSDVYPDGRSMLVQDGIQRARMRCADDSECFLVPGVATEVTVDLWSTALVFNAGHRIRVSVAGSNAPRFEVNPNNGDGFDGDLPAVVARPELLFGAAHPSRIELPVPKPSRRRGGRRLAPVSNTVRPALGVTVNSCGDMPPEGEGGVIAELAEAGMDFYTLRAEWRDLENPDTLALFRWAIPWAKGLGMRVMLTIPTVDTVIRTIPDDLQGLSMDDPALMARFDQTLAALITPEVAAGLDYVSVGNEVDSYLAAHPEEAQPFAAFAAHAYDTLRSLGVSAPSCVTVTHRGLEHDSEGAVDRLLDDCGFLPVTYYPMGEGFQFLDPAVVEADVAAVLGRADGLPVVFQEVGYSSAAANGGSEARQAEFLDRVFGAATGQGALEAVNVDWYCDVPRHELEVLAQELYGVGPENPLWEPFLGFLSSLGLKHEGGTPKQAYQVFLDAIGDATGVLAEPRSFAVHDRHSEVGSTDDGVDFVGDQGWLRPNVLVGPNPK
jgi:predicted acyl esterase